MQDSQEGDEFHLQEVAPDMMSVLVKQVAVEVVQCVLLYNSVIKVKY